jgi:uncharacterized membrane protein YGL010W
VADAIQKYGLFAAAGIVALLVIGWVAYFRGRTRFEERL